MSGKAFLTLALSLLTTFCKAQEAEAYRIPAGSNILRSIPRDKIYLYPRFVQGKVLAKDGNQYEATLNYNTVSAEIEFLSDNYTDTAVLINKFNIKLVVIETDSFCYTDRFLKLFGGNERWKYAREIRFAVVSRGGQVEQGVLHQAALLGRTLGDWEQLLVLKQDLVIARKQFYYIGSRFYNFLPVNKKTLLQLFPAHSSRIKSYLRKHQVKFQTEAEILSLLRFVENLE